MANERPWFIRISKRVIPINEDLEEVRKTYEKETGFKVTIQDDDSAVKFNIDQTKPIIIYENSQSVRT